MNQDIILKKPTFVMQLEDKEKIAILQNPRHLNVIKIIHDKNNKATLTEIVEKYSQIASEEQAKSESTVYRCLQDLIRLNLVQESGRRVLEGKTITQTLYSLTSEYIIVDEPEIDWNSFKGQKLFIKIIASLRILFPSKVINEQSLYQWLLKFQTRVDEDKKRLITSNNDKILEILSIWSPFSINEIMEFIGWFCVIINNPDAQNEFLECFDKVDAPFTSSKLETEHEIKDKKPIFKDLIREWPQILSIIENDDKRLRYYYDSAYIPILTVFRDGILTIKEIIKRYNQISLVKKRKSTIYGYVKTLKEADLVKEVGQRVIHGKKATEKLYALNARIISRSEARSWESEQRKWLFNSSMTLLSYLYSDFSFIDKEKFQKFRVKATSYEVECTERFSLTENEEIVKIFYKYNWQDFWQIYTTVIDFYYFLNIESIYAHIRNCLSD